MVQKQPDTNEGMQALIGAIRTLRMFIDAQLQKNNPKAKEMAAHLQALIATLSNEQAQPAAPVLTETRTPNQPTASARPVVA